MQNSFVFRYSLESPEELYRRVNEPTWHIVGVTWLKCTSDSGYEQIPTDTGGGIDRPGNFSRRCAVFRETGRPVVNQ